MILCYVDESGTPEIPGNTSHYVLAGLSIPVERWKDCDRDINSLKKRFSLQNAEIHTAWMMRRYIEQNKITGFDTFDSARRIHEVQAFRTNELLALQRRKNLAQYRQTKKNYQKTLPYIHLTERQRQSFIEEVAKTIGGWGFVRLFAECIDKVHFDPVRSGKPVNEQAFEQLVSRFDTYLNNVKKQPGATSYYGLLIHDNNETVAKRHTQLMKTFQQTGTLWRKISNIIETPLFVSSELTSMVQLADVCSYALRRYLENGDKILFSHIFRRADRKDTLVVGVRHFTKPSCPCEICTGRKPVTTP